MRKALRQRFQLQLLFALVAAVSVTALAIDLVFDAAQHAEGFVLNDTHRALEHAMQELSREYRLRQQSSDAAWTDLPSAARDLTLGAITQTVLSSYPGVEGGFWTRSQFLGYSYPTHDGGSVKVDVPAAEKMSIEEVIEKARVVKSAQRVLRGKRDIVVISAVYDGQTAVWVMKRLPGQAEPVGRSRTVLLTILVGAAFLGAGGVLATGIGLHRGVAQIKSGLAALDQNFAPDLPQRSDELGQISAAINEMARTRQRLEVDLRRQDRARTIGRLVGQIAHEIRNPLNSIRLALQMLAQRQQQNRLSPEDFGMVLDQVDRMSGLLSDLLAFQQPRPPRIEQREIGPILEGCTQLVSQQARKQGVDFALAGEVTQSAFFDEQYLRQIIVNLALNAIEVSKQGQAVRIGTSRSGGSVIIQVSDEGPGLTPEQREHLFEPFFTTKAKGHGLGLAVSLELARSMGASLSCDAHSGSGATFVLRLKGVNGD